MTRLAESETWASISSRILWERGDGIAVGGSGDLLGGGALEGEDLADGLGGGACCCCEFLDLRDFFALADFLTFGGSQCFGAEAEELAVFG